MALAVGAFVASAIALSPANGASKAVRALSKPRVSLEARGGLGSFTPAASNPRLAAVLARSALANSGFRFTPSTSSIRLNRSVTVAVRSRGGSAASRGGRSGLVASSVISGISPVAYNLGVAVGWKRFAIAGDVTKVDLGALGGREEADVGVSYSGSRWTGRLTVGADRPTGAAPRALTGEAGYSVDVGGSYSIARNVDLMAGVRYRTIERDRLALVADNHGDSQAVYIGTAVKF